MIKYYIFLIALSMGIPLESMEIELSREQPLVSLAEFVFSTRSNILPHITQEICDNNDSPQAIVHDMHALLLTNKALSEYFSQYFTDTQIAQNIVKKIATRFNDTELETARVLGNCSMVKKIKEFYLKVHYENEDLTYQDSQNRGYLNATFCEKDLQKEWHWHYVPNNSSLNNEDKRAWFLSYSRPDRMTLLLVACALLREKKVKKLMNAGVDATSDITKNPIAFIAAMSCDRPKKEDRIKYCSIIRFLIACGIDPDSRYDVDCPTILHRAVAAKWPRFCCSLLRAGANPYKLLLTDEAVKRDEVVNDLLMGIDSTDIGRVNAFTIKGEKRIKWLKKLVAQVAAEKNTKQL